MSGIVSLLFCGITLKHYAYHTMSHKTQRATKYIFSTLARLSENFIFIYLGIALFTSAPISEPVTSYVKPLFITISTVAVVFTRYAAVFPLSEAINLFHKHARGQRTEEFPHSYQMMLFWAGLRGAVGVALAAGFIGPNAQILQTTVLVVVVVTVLIFGGTSLRMLEVLGIRTGVEDEEDNSSDEEDYASTRRYRGQYVNARFMDEEPSALASYPNLTRGPGRIGTHYHANNYNHHGQVPQSPQGIFSAASSDSFDSDLGEVLPMAPTDPIGGHPPRQSVGGGSAGAGEDGKWFQALDERYLLPLFSNATASRTFNARRASRRLASGNGSGNNGGGTPVATGSGAVTPVESEDDNDGAQELELGQVRGHGHVRWGPRGNSVDLSRTERGLPSPMLRSSSLVAGEGRIS
jgi:solute carrier family 9 (sodium/hydrogen exchanger), member 6/7